MKKKIGLGLLLIAVTAGMAFAEAVNWTTDSDFTNGRGAIKVNWVDTSYGILRVNYTLLRNVESMSINATVTFASATAGASSKQEILSNKESWIKEGSTYTAHFNPSKGSISEVRVWLSGVVMKK